MPGLFDPLPLRDLTLRNRIGVAPMCQYSSVDGMAADWHLVHLGARAAGGAGLVITEATAVEPRGRISPFDLGLWNDGQIGPLARIADFIRSQGAASAAQLAHAGRKASRTATWGSDGRSRERGLTAEEGAWRLCGPSAAMEGDFGAPEPLDAAGIQRVLDAFAASAARADRAGFDAVEVHAAHGYLANSFASPVSNRREDDFGGAFENRARFLLEIARAIRSVWPEGKPLLFRLSATDWIDAGWTIDDTIRLAPLLQREGVDLIDCSSGGVAPAAIPVGPGYQVPLAEAVRTRGGVPSAAVGLIESAAEADRIVRQGQADLVLLGRASLRDPYWPLRAAIELGAAASARVPIQYGAGWRKAGFHHDPLGVPVIE
jgi:2,4-dienoyl-CoA reductase-like NADH-dependent reductase (Old Yellow Enzyme family)